MNLDPSSHVFDEQDLTVSVGTNNPTGYQLTVSTVGDSNTLVNTVDNTKTIPNLSTSYSVADFPVNYWGYRISNGSTSSGDYGQFTSGSMVSESDSAVNDITKTLGFGAKIDYTKPSGLYQLDLNFTAVANPVTPYIQDYNVTTCATEASSSSVTVIDRRDNNDYQVRYINGNCWMVQNLRYIGDTGSTAPSGSTAGSMIMKADTSNIEADVTIPNTDLTQGNSYGTARIHVATSNQVPSGLTVNDIGVWYNYAAASAMTITGSSNTDVQTYDVCPAGWRLPTNSETSGIVGYKDAFNPVAGGYYYATSIYTASYGYWWSSKSYDAKLRYDLRWFGSTSLGTNAGDRINGEYIRCIRST